ncbi:MAG: DUF370 domain-containing protein [Oscillospiraceae bacterium]|nr:DUF370 domain-containing protein [Oscillospiraceae bacterium]
MYLHLGQSEVVPARTIVGIFDLDITSQSKITRTFLTESEKNKLVINVSDELPKSFVVCDDCGRKKVYISQLSSSTLQKRAMSSTFDRSDT